MTMTKAEFRKKVVAPLIEKFGYAIVFNGAEAEGMGLRSTGGSYLGLSFTGRKGKPIVLRWQRDFYATVQTLFHEIGHSCLHGKGSGFKGGKNLKEMEAEMVAREACRLLGLPYRAGFRSNPNVNYIEFYRKRYHESCVRIGCEEKRPREENVMIVARQVAGTLKGVIA